MHGDPVAGPWSGRVGMSITRAMAWTSLLWGGVCFVSPGQSASVPEQEAPGQKHTDSRQRAPDPANFPAQPCNPRWPGRRVGGQPWAAGPHTHLETLQPQPSG